MENSISLDVDAEGTSRSISATTPDPIISTNYDEYAAGYVGLTTYCEAKFENIRFFNNDPVGFTTNLNGIHGVQGDWSTPPPGVIGATISEAGTCSPCLPTRWTAVKPFVFEGDMHLENGDGIGGLVFGVQNPDDPLGPTGTASMWANGGTPRPRCSKYRWYRGLNIQRGLTQAEIEKRITTSAWKLWRTAPLTFIWMAAWWAPM